LQHASLEIYSEYESFFWLSGEKLTPKEAFRISDLFLNELEVLEEVERQAVLERQAALVSALETDLY
jgi:hypothetical protein